MLSQLEIAEHCGSASAAYSLRWLDWPRHVRLLGIVLSSGLHAAVLPPESLLRICVKHWQNEVFHDLCSKLWRYLSDRNFVACSRGAASSWTVPTWHSRAAQVSIGRDLREFHNVTVLRV